MESSDVERARAEYENIMNGSRKEISTVCQKYLKALVDTRAAPKTGIPTLIGGYPGRTGIVRFTEQIEVSTGATSFGFLGLHLANADSSGRVAGPFRDTNNFVFSNAAWGPPATIPRAGSVLPTGLNLSGWSQSKRLAADGTGANLAKYFQYRLVGCTVKVFPESSFATQNGRIALLEPPGHEAVNGNGVDFSANDLESSPTAHVIRGVQTGDQAEQIVLNWHPRSSKDSTVSYSEQDFEFSGLGSVPSIPSQVPVISDGIIGFYATPGTMFHIEISGMYEVRGLSVTDLQPRLTDSRGMDLVLNTLAHKMISGYVGRPERVYEGYLHQTWKAAQELYGNVKSATGAVSDVLTTIAGFL